jgi:hypothetical protein
MTFALLLTENLTAAQNDIGNTLITQVAGSPAPDSTRAFLEKQKADLAHASRAFGKATATITIPGIIDRCTTGGHRLATVADALEAMASQNLTRNDDNDDFERIVGLLTRVVPKPTTDNKANKGTMDKAEVEGLLAQHPNPKKIGRDLDRQRDPAKLKTLYDKVRTPAVGAPGTVLNRPDMKTLASWDANLETKGLLDIGVPYAVLRGAIGQTDLLPKHLAEITSEEVANQKPVDAQNLITYALARGTHLKKMFDERDRQPNIVRQMKTKNVTIAEAGEMARFEHKDYDKNEPTINIKNDTHNFTYGVARLDHFVKRHTYKHFDFYDIKNSQTFWPEGTQANTILEDLKSFLKTHKPNINGSTIDNKYIYIETWPPGGTKNSITQFYPTTLGFTDAKMDRFKYAFFKK